MNDPAESTSFSPEPWPVEVVEPIRRIGREQRFRGVRIARHAPVLRHFTAAFELL